MEIKQLWCVGYYNNEQLKLAFRVYDAVLNGEKHTIDFNIPVNREDFIVTSHPDLVVIKNIKELQFNMIAQTEGIHIIKRLENNTDFVTMITPIIKEYMLNRQFHVNFELNEQARKLLM